MVQLEPDGRLVFSFAATDAREVFLLGAFHGWTVERLPMHRSTTGEWTLELDLPPGDYLFQYEVDGVLTTDDEAHGTRIDGDGRPWSRAWRPNLTWAEAGFAGSPRLDPGDAPMTEAA
jgi:hypothetical protein